MLNLLCISSCDTVWWSFYKSGHFFISSLVLCHLKFLLFLDCHSHDGIMSRHPSVPLSIISSHRTQSCLSCPSMHCFSSPHKPTDVLSQTGMGGPPRRPSSISEFLHFTLLLLLFSQLQRQPSPLLPFPLPSCPPPSLQTPERAATAAAGVVSLWRRCTGSCRCCSGSWQTVKVCDRVQSLTN